MIQKISPFLWFDDQAEEAAKFYTSVFKKSKILNVARYGESGSEVSGRKAGSVMVVDFEIEGQQFSALNGGPIFKFTEAISFVVNCKDQKEVDYFWESLSKGGSKSQCGWLKDKFGVSWQVVPSEMAELMGKGTPKQAEAVMKAMLTMQKIDMEALKKAFKQN